MNYLISSTRESVSFVVDLSTEENAQPCYPHLRMTRVFHSIFACRILLHLRSAANSRLLSSTMDAVRSNLSIGRFRVNAGARDLLNNIEGVGGNTRLDEDAHGNFELAEMWR